MYLIILFSKIALAYILNLIIFLQDLISYRVCSLRSVCHYLRRSIGQSSKSIAYKLSSGSWFFDCPHIQHSGRQTSA